MLQNARASYDFSSNDPYPYPRYTDDWFNSHGTRCAGEVSGARDNGICGVGVAYDSMIAGIRMLDQPYMTDLIEANSMGHEPNLIDIYRYANCFRYTTEQSFDKEKIISVPVGVRLTMVGPWMVLATPP